MSGMLIENANVDDDADADERQSAHTSTHYMHIAVHIPLLSLCIYCIISQRDKQSAQANEPTNQPAKNSSSREIVYVSTFKLICAECARARWLDVCGMHFY